MYVLISCNGSRTRTHTYAHIHTTHTHTHHKNTPHTYTPHTHMHTTNTHHTHTHTPHTHTHTTHTYTHTYTHTNTYTHHTTHTHTSIYAHSRISLVLHRRNSFTPLPIIPLHQWTVLTSVTLLIIQRCTKQKLVHSFCLRSQQIRITYGIGVYKGAKC